MEMNADTFILKTNTEDKKEKWLGESRKTTKKNQ